MCPLRATLRERIAVPSGNDMLGEAHTSPSSPCVEACRLACIALLICASPSLLTKASTQIVFGFLKLRVGKEVLRLSDFDQSPLQKEGSHIGNTSRLLHVVRHDDHRVVLFELPDQFFHLQR